MDVVVTGDWVIFPNHYKVSPPHTGVLLSSSNETFLIDFPSNERESGATKLTVNRPERSSRKYEKLYKNSLSTAGPWTFSRQ